MPEDVAIGVDLGGTKIEAVALDASGVELLRRRIPSPSHAYDAIVEAVAGLIESLEREIGARGTIGVGTPGAPSLATGLMKNANSTALIGKPLARDLEACLRRPVRLANDANCFALSEATDGAACGAETVFGVILGTGVGGGVIIGGRLVIGANAIGGEWGHNPLPWARDDERPGPPCYCGKRGCIETFLSGPALARSCESNGRAGDARAIAEAAAMGEPRAVAALERYGDRLARALATVVNVLDPHVIVLGGGVSNIAMLYDVVPESMRRYVFSDTVDTLLVRAKHGDSSGVRGAARLWADASVRR